MPWWGGGSSDSSSGGGGGREADFTSHDEVGSMGATSSISAPSMGGGGGGGAGMADMQRVGMALQQQLMVQQVINDLTDRSYEKCITSKPSETLSGSQAACIKSTVNKWLDTNEFMTGRLQKKSQQQQGMM